MDVIDAHLHIQPWKLLKQKALQAMMHNRKDLDDIHRFIDSPKAFVEHLDKAGVSRAVVVNYPAPDVMGFTEEVNDFVADYCKQFPSRLVAVGAIDPRHTRNPVKGMDRLLGKLKIKGLKVHPPHQLFHANAYRTGLKGLAVLYKKAESEGIPVIIHTGTSIFPNARNVYGDPLPIDDVCVDFPDLKVIIAHGGRPLWMDTTFFLMRRHKNAYLDLSGIPPKRVLEYFPRLEEIADRTMFGSDWPGPGVKNIRSNVDDFMALPLSDATKRKILYSTAFSLFC